MREFDALGALIGGYLNEDWYLEYGDHWTAVEAFVRYEPDFAPRVRADIECLLARSDFDQETVEHLDEYGLGYAATNDGWSSYEAWLHAVADRVDELLHRSPAA